MAFVSCVRGTRLISEGVYHATLSKWNQGFESPISRHEKQSSDTPQDMSRAAKGFTHNTQRDEVIHHESGKRWRLSSFMKGKF